MIFIKLIRKIEKHKELELIFWKKREYVYRAESNDKLLLMSTKCCRCICVVCKEHGINKYD